MRTGHTDSTSVILERLGFQLSRGTRSMWSGLDPELRRQLACVHLMVALRYQTPTHEWPLIFMDQYDELLVVREWPDGSITAYCTTEHSDIIRNGA